MPKSNEDASVSLNKLERPPLKRPKTLSIPSSTSTTNRRFDLTVSIENGSPAGGNGDFPNEQWKYPSFLGTTRRKRTTVKPNNKIQKLPFSNSMGSKIGGDQKKAGNSSVAQAPPANSSSSSSSSSSAATTTTNTSSTSFSSSTSTSVVTLQDHSSTRRPHQSKHTLILYLVSDLFALDFIFFYLLFLFSPVSVHRIHFK